MFENWDDLRIFLALAREGKLTAVAKKLNVSHPTVARRVKQLEAAVGARLFDRLPDRFVLTPAGEALLGDVQAMEDAAASIHRRSAGMNGDVLGSVRISAGEAMMDYLARNLPRPAPQPQLHRVRIGRQPPAGQSLAARGRPDDPGQSPGSCVDRDAQAGPSQLCHLRARSISP